MTLPHLYFTSVAPQEILGEIVETYRLAAEKLGYPTSYTHAAIVPDAINILFFFWNVPWTDLECLHPDCIFVNFEPLTPASHAWLPRHLETLSKSYVWEYSRVNYQNQPFLQINNTDWLPLSFNSDAAQILTSQQRLPNRQQDIDVVFIGSMTTRRTRIIDELRKKNVRIAFTNGGVTWSQEERTEYLRRSKIALNFHNWDDFRVVEQSRLHIFFRHHKAVVCEMYPDSEVAPELRDAVVGVPYEDLVDAILDLLDDAPRRARLEDAGLKALAKLPAQELNLGPALERFLQWRAQQNPLPPAHQAQLETVLLHLDHPPQTSLLELQTTEQALRASLGGLPAVVLTHEFAPNFYADSNFPTHIAPLPLPSGSGLAAHRNLAIVHGRHHEFISFLSVGELPQPQKLAEQLLFLQAHPELDIVGCHIDTQDPAAPLQYPERDYHFKAQLLEGSMVAPPLSSFMVRMRFVQQHGLRFDAEFDAGHSDLQFLCKCTALGARFAVLPRALLRRRPATVRPMDEPELLHRAALAKRARKLIFSTGLPGWKQQDIDLLASLYAHQWPADTGFAKELLRALNKAMIDLPQSSLGFEQGTLGRVFSKEAAHIIEVFHSAGFISLDWIEALFDEPDLAYLLVPVRAELPRKAPALHTLPTLASAEL